MLSTLAIAGDTPTQCPTGAYKRRGESGCMRCPAGRSTTYAGSANSDTCLCIPGYVPAASGACVACPAESFAPMPSPNSPQVTVALQQQHCGNTVTILWQQHCDVTTLGCVAGVCGVWCQRDDVGTIWTNSMRMLARLSARGGWQMHVMPSRLLLSAVPQGVLASPLHA